MNLVLPNKFVIPEVVSTHFHLEEGQQVVDLGAGNGFFLKILSEAVGPSGKVFACEIQKALVDKLGEFARNNGLQNVTPLWCDAEEIGGIKLLNDSVDVVLLINTLFQFEEKTAVLAEIRRVLKHSGVLHVIDWSESFGGLGPQPVDVISKQEATDLCESNYFIFERDYPAGDHHYGFSVRKI